MTEMIVCGAGAAGLAAAASLRSAGVGAIVLERTEEVGASWRTRYDGLRLNTTGWMSTQPGYRALSGLDTQPELGCHACWELIRSKVGRLDRNRVSPLVGQE